MNYDFYLDRELARYNDDCGRNESEEQEFDPEPPPEIDYDWKSPVRH